MSQYDKAEIKIISISYANLSIPMVHWTSTNIYEVDFINSNAPRIPTGLMLLCCFVSLWLSDSLSCMFAWGGAPENECCLFVKRGDGPWFASTRKEIMKVEQRIYVWKWFSILSMLS